MNGYAKPCVACLRFDGEFTKVTELPNFLEDYKFITQIEVSNR